MPSDFVHLSIHSDFSMVDSILTVKSIAKLTKESQQVAACVTDQNNLFGMVQWYKTCMSAGIKPIIGASITTEILGDSCQLSLICMNNTGYKNLSKIMSEAYTKNQNEQGPIIEFNQLINHSEGLITVCGYGSSAYSATQNNKTDQAREIIRYLSGELPHLILSVSRTGRCGEEYWVDFVKGQSLPVIAVNDVCFAEESDFEAHEIRVCIKEGALLDDPNRVKKYTKEQYFKSSEQMIELFKDMPQACENTLLIAKACNLSLDLGNNYLPEFPIPSGMTADAYFAMLCISGLEKRFMELPYLKNNESKQAEYRQRLDIEINTIIGMGFVGYFLIVADFIQWAKAEKIPVGPGRGSGAGSLVAYALSITDLDPIPYDLLFERFLNPERVSMPDFDIDFCMDRRDEVIDYVARRYGRDRVSQIITHGTMAAKSVIKDIGRTLGMPYPVVDRIAKLIPNEVGISLKEALEKEPDLKAKFESEEEVNRLITLGLKLEGLIRNAGRHAGGVVISPTELWNFSPMYCEADGSNLVTQFDKNDVESVGLVKFDFLGLRTLTVVDWAVNAINQNSFPAVVKQAKPSSDLVNISQIDLNDKSTYEMIKTGKTTGVFQLESSGMQDLIRKLKPDCFEDIIALVALFRPGPLGSGMVDDFIRCKHGEQEVAYPHSCLESVLKPTYGTILYQEQVMQTAQIMAKYTLGGADLLRRAMGKKKPEEMAKQRSIFCDGAVANGIDAEVAGKTFDIMEEFANYGFNKSHSAAYALVSYQTAWLKTHYPAFLMASALTADLDNIEKTAHIVKECKEMGLVLLPPCVQSSFATFAVIDEKTISYGLGAIKGVDEDRINSIIKDRQENGYFIDFYDFIKRSHKTLNRRIIKSLIASGACDCFGESRSWLYANIEVCLKTAEKESSDQHSGQLDIFSSMTTIAYETAKDWTLNYRLTEEKLVLGHYLSGHPLDELRNDRSGGVLTVSEILNLPAYQEVKFIARIDDIRSKISQKDGNKMVFITLEDQELTIGTGLFGDMVELAKSIDVDDLVMVEGVLVKDKFTGGIKVKLEKMEKVLVD